MTGFARVRKQSDAGEASVSVKSVNHRALDVHFRLPGELDPFEPVLRAAVKRHVVRGHIQVQISFCRTSGAPAVTLNRSLLDAYVAAYRRVSEKHGLGGAPDLNAALSLPGMFQETSDEEPDQTIERLLVQTTEEALQALNAFREREGSEIVAELLERAAAIRGCASRMEEIRSRAVPAYQSRLQERLAELLKNVPLDPQRLAQEAAILADRSDISEELTRLRIHAGQVEELLRNGGEVGKKLDFLLQEMNRESNTILSKSNGIGEQGLEITQLGLAVRADVEKLREQSLNLE